jgi:Anaphase-promoting complex subunit 4 WD40 domain/WD domain, G-beta repeat
MKTVGLVIVTSCLSSIIFAQSQAPKQQEAARPFPDPDFILQGENIRQGKSGVVLGPTESDGKGGTKGTFAVYGDSSQIQISSLSFSADGRLLAIGTTPNRVELWDVEKRAKLRSLTTGTTVGLTSDGHLLATDGNGIEIWDVSSGKMQKRIPRTSKQAENVVDNFTFNAAGTLLDVTANGDDDAVYDVSTGKLVATLTNTRHAQFSNDGSLLIGGDDRHLVIWNTKDWSTVRDLPNGPDYVTTIAAFPEKDLVVIGGPKMARLLRLSSGEEVARVGLGYTNFAAFSQNGSLIFMYPSSGFGIWDTTGKQYCVKAHLGNGTAALSAHNRWLAAASVGGKSVMVWNVQSALSACGVSSTTTSP